MLFHYRKSAVRFWASVSCGFWLFLLRRSISFQRYLIGNKYANMAMYWLWQHANMVISHICHRNEGHVKMGVVLLKSMVKMVCSEKRENNWSQNFVPLPYCIQVTNDGFELCAFLVGYSTQYHNSATTKPSCCLYALIRKSFIATLVDPDSAVAKFQAKFRFIVNGPVSMLAYAIESVPESIEIAQLCSFNERRSLRPT